MRACTTANAIFLGLALGVAAFAACTGQSTPPQTSQSPGSSETEAQPAATSGPSASGTPGAATSPEATKPAAKQPETTADCKELATDITNEPPATAVPMNNASPTPDGSASSDRLQPLVDLIKAKRDAFRCCFDLWARKNPGASGRIMLKVKLKPDGSVMSAETVDKDSTVQAPEVNACIIDVAKSLTYPKSPSGKETVYTHPFDFKARR